MNKILIVCGPTATGKTALAASLAKKFNGELVSADSRQVYHGMDLVTGKDRPASTTGGPDVPIWLYDVVDPDEEFSVSLWVKLAREAIADIVKRNKLPIVVGGTGLYIKALLAPFDSIDIAPNERLRKKLNTLSVKELQQMTIQGQMNNSDWHNPRRLIRKIEIQQSKKSTKSAYVSYDSLMVGLTASIAVLDHRIDERLKIRNEMGLEKEVTSLLSRYDSRLPSMSAIGLNEHAYARRQMTWFQKISDIVWFDVDQAQLVSSVEARVNSWYTHR